MAAKVRIKVGGVEIDYEGPEGFLDKKLLGLVTQLSSLADHTASATLKGKDPSVTKDPGTLASFLKSKNATSQNKRFLATAEWLHRKGSETLKTADVTKALRDNRQTSLGNPTQCRNNNVTSGYCEKVDKNTFFVTDDGRKHLG